MAGLRTGFGAAPPTRSGIVRGALGAVLVASALSVCLFGECEALSATRGLKDILGEAAATLRDAGTQWMIFVCAGIYFLTLVILRRRLAGAGTGTRWNASLPGELWLVGLLAVVALVYAFDYTQAVKSTQALTLLGGAVLGQGAAFWESRKQKAEMKVGGRWSAR